MKPLPFRHPGLFLAMLVLATAPADDYPQWRGPQRDGHARETDLLASWPKEGPQLRWQAQHLGSGYSTPAVVGQRLYLISNHGLDNEFVQALSAEDGQPVWTRTIGKVGNPDQKPTFPAARSTPTVDGTLLYALGSDGDLVCLETLTGNLRWRKQLRRDFGGTPGTWAYAESPLIDGNTLLCTPGGPQATLVALDKRSGNVLWKTALPEADEAAYASAIRLDVDGLPQYVQMLQKGLVGVDAKTGRFLWRYDKTVSKYGANIPSPVAHANRVFSAGAGTGGGLVQLTRQDQTVTAQPLYFSPKLPTAIGGAVRVGDFLYGTTGQAMLCVRFDTGDIQWEERALGAASICCADGRLYLHAESGEVGLVEPTPEAYREVGRFTPPDLPSRSNAMEKAWAYPVVAHGRLYIRDLDRLWCYDVRKSPAPPSSTP